MHFYFFFFLFPGCVIALIPISYYDGYDECNMRNIYIDKINEYWNHWV